MMIKKLIEEKQKDKDFAEEYDREGRKLETAVALYHGGSRPNSSGACTKSTYNSIYYCSN